MPTYIVYENSSGKIFNVHREIMADTDETTELSDKEVMDQVKGTLPKGVKLAVTVVDEYPKPVRGYSYYIDLNTESLMLIENRPKKRSKKK
jgi:hypothetical protein